MFGYTSHLAHSLSYIVHWVCARSHHLKGKSSENDRVQRGSQTLHDVFAHQVCNSNLQVLKSVDVIVIAFMQAMQH